MAVTTANAAFSLLGNGQGYIYVTDQSNVIYGGIGWENSGIGKQRLEWEFLYRNPRPSSGGVATSFAEMTAVDAGGDNLTGFTINGVSQVNPASLPIAMVAGNFSASVLVIVNAMNAYTVPSPNDYRGFQTASTTFNISRILEGAAANGDVVALTFDGDTVVEATNVGAGTDLNVALLKYWVDVSNTAVENVLGAGAVDITDVASYQPLNAPTQIQTVSVSSNTITCHREVAITRVEIDGVASPTTNEINTIIFEGGQKGDVVIFCGIDGSVPPKFMQGVNIPIDQASITLTGYAQTLIMSYDGSDWSQVVPSTPSVDYLRDQGQNLPVQPGVHQLNPPAGGTQVIHVGVAGTDIVGDTYSQNISFAAGAVINLASTLDFQVDPALGNNGDSGKINGKGRSINVGAQTLVFSDPNGVVATLTPELALSGLWEAEWLIVDVASDTVAWSVSPIFDNAAVNFITSAMVESLDGAKVDNATIDASTKVVDDSVTEVKLDTIVRAKLNVQGRNRVVITIPTAQVLTLNTIPVLAVAAVGANKVILVEQWTAKITYNSVAYATNVGLQLIFTGAGSAVALESTFLTRTANGTVNMPLKTNAGISVTQLISNTDLYVSVAVGDPTAGNSDIVIYIDYSVLDV